MKLSHRIAPCLWFDHEAEEAARYYTSIFPNSAIRRISRYTKAGFEIHGRPAGSVMTVEFDLDGHVFTALNGGPLFKFNESISFEIYCETQEEVDRYWNRLTQGGDPNAQQCGWLKDKYGLSWQVVPIAMLRMFDGSEGSERAMKAFLEMKKIDIAELERAWAGETVVTHG